MRIAFRGLGVGPRFITDASRVTVTCNAKGCEKPLIAKFVRKDKHIPLAICGGGAPMWAARGGVAGLCPPQQAARAAPARLGHPPPLWHHGEDEDPCPASEGNDPTRGLESAPARHEQVHYDDVRPRGCGARDGLVAAPGLAHDPKAAPPLEQRAQAGAEDGVIVH